MKKYKNLFLNEYLKSVAFLFGIRVVIFLTSLSLIWYSFMKRFFLETQWNFIDIVSNYFSIFLITSVLVYCFPIIVSKILKFLNIFRQTLLYKTIITVKKNNPKIFNLFLFSIIFIYLRLENHEFFNQTLFIIIILNLAFLARILFVSILVIDIFFTNEKIITYSHFDSVKKYFHTSPTLFRGIENPELGSKVIDGLVPAAISLSSLVFADSLTRGDSELNFINSQVNELKDKSSTVINQLNVVIDNIEKLEQEQTSILNKKSSLIFQTIEKEQILEKLQNLQECKQKFSSYKNYLDQKKINLTDIVLDCSRLNTFELAQERYLGGLTTHRSQVILAKERITLFSDILEIKYRGFSDITKLNDQIYLNSLKDLECPNIIHRYRMIKDFKQMEIDLFEQELEKNVEKCVFPVPSALEIKTKLGNFFSQFL